MNTSEFPAAFKRLGLSETKLADKLGVNRSTIYRLNHGSPVTRPFMLAMAHLEAQQTLRDVLQDMQDYEIPSHIWVRIAALVGDDA